MLYIPYMYDVQSGVCSSFSPPQMWQIFERETTCLYPHSILRFLKPPIQLCGCFMENLSLPQSLQYN